MTRDEAQSIEEGHEPALGRPIRVVLGKLALDAHNRGFNFVTMRLRDAGMEVIPMRVSFADQLVTVAEQEDADVIGLSILTGAHMKIAGDLVEASAQRGLDDVTFLVGGIVPDEDIDKLRDLGVDAVYPASTKDTGDIVAFIEASVQRKRGDSGEQGT